MKALLLLAMCGTFYFASGKLFHSSSVIVLRPSGDGLDTQFGFSMAYQNVNNKTSRLVVGAPREEVFGSVYTCPLTNANNDIYCSSINSSSFNKSFVKKAFVELRKRSLYEQKVLFGSSIAATSDLILACAPFVPKFFNYVPMHAQRNIKAEKTFGSCYIQSSRASDFSEFKDNSYKIRDKHLTQTDLKEQHIQQGGIGFNTLVDTKNRYLLVAKTAFPTDIMYVDVDSPLTASKSLFEFYYGMSETFMLTTYYNFGYGMAFGTFFDSSVTLYAISVSFSDLDLYGRILFLKEIPENRSLEIFRDPGRNVFSPYFIDNKDIGVMFGYALAAAYINNDQLSELLVGAPAYSNGESIELGALHIYIGGDMLSRFNKNRMRTIYGSKNEGRFGSAIVTNDIDGDGIPEIFVSAPYEDSGVGAVYMISGDELNQILIKGTEYKEIQLSQLQLTQRLQGVSSSKHFGFSLQIVKDIDDNGCDELAVGSPGNSMVELMRCLPAVKTSIFLKLLGPEIVKENADHFTVEVCLKVIISQKCHDITGNILVHSFVTGEAKIKEPSFQYNMTKDKQTDQYCNNVNVQLPVKKTKKGTYMFTAKLSVDGSPDRESKDYKSWVVLAAQSVTEAQRTVNRHCDGVECQPDLTYSIFKWSGRKYIDAQTALNETLDIAVHNAGSETNEAQVLLTVRGGRISALTSQCYKENSGNEYVCSLPTLKRNSSEMISVILDTAGIDNVLSLNITAMLHDKGFKQLQYKPKDISIPVQLDPASVILKGSEHYLNVTDEDIGNSNIVTFSGNHEFNITNNGFVTWQLTAVLEKPTESYIKKVKIETSDICKPGSSDRKFEFRCRLIPGAVAKITVDVEISKENFESKITNEDIQIFTGLSIDLLPTNKSIHGKSLIQLQYKKILSVGNNRNFVIAIVVTIALILLLAFVLVLTKYGFFKRTKKEKLLVLQNSVRKRSIRMASESSKTRKPSVADGSHCDIEVMDDVFTEVDITPQASKDNVDLVEDTPK